MDTLISAQELARHLDDPGWMIFDCRFSLADEHAGWRAYVWGHIPGARHVDMNQHLSAVPVPGRTGRHPLPERGQWIGRVQRWGISPARQVVVYDDAGGAAAARMWWMLRWIGHEQVALLDGGWQAWLHRERPVSHKLAGEPVPAQFDYSTLAPLARTIEADEIDAASQLVLDAREGARFRGEVEPIDAVAGHIPGARNAPVGENLDAQGRLRAPRELRERFERLRQGRDADEVVCYCGSGVTAAHNILAMKVAGLREPRLYAGSWSEWITDESRPVATGPA